MSDPLSGGGASKVAQEMLKEVQTAMQQVDRAGQSQQVQGPQFAELLEAQRVGDAQRVGGPQSATDILRAATQAQRAPAVPPVGTAIDTGRLQNGLKRIIEDVMQGQNKYGKILDLAMSGREFSQTELLALQAGVYRFSQELELTSKVVEKGTAAIKQTLNTQV
jgi:hypothetical protein